MARPERRAPTAGNRLTPQIDSFTPGGAAESPPAVAEQPAQPMPQPAQTPQPAPSTRAIPAQQPHRPEGTKSLSTRISADLYNRAQTAVLRTAGQPDGVRSMRALVERALENELDRLARTHNQGQEWAPHDGPFRTGRPLGA